MADAYDPFAQFQGGQDLLGGISSGDATSLALLDAMSQIQKAGLQRTASPIGSIAQNLAPLFAAPAQAHQIQQEMAIRDFLARAKMVDAIAQLQNATGSGAPLDPRDERLKDLKVQEAEGKLKYQEALLKRIGIGGDAGTEAAPNTLGGATKQRLVFGPNGPTLTQYDDTKSPARMAQDQQIAQQNTDRAIAKTFAEQDARQRAELDKPIGDKAPLYVNPETLQPASPKTTRGELNDQGYVALTASQAQALPEFARSRGALDRIRRLVETGVAGDGKPLFPDSTGSSLGDIFAAGGNAARLKLRPKDPVVNSLQTETGVGIVPLLRGLAHIGRPPQQELVNLQKALGSGNETKQSLLSKIDAVDRILDDGVLSMGIDPQILRMRTRKDIPVHAAPTKSVQTQSGKSYTIEELP